MHKKTTLFTLFWLATTILIFPYNAHASQLWQSFCANVTTGSSNIGTNNISATNYTVQAVDNPAVKMTAQELSASKTNSTLSSDQLKRVSNITSTGILNLVLNHQMKQCNKSYYTDSLTPLMNSLQQGDKVDFKWKNVNIQNGKASYKAKQLTAQLSGQGNNIHIIIRFSGLATTSQQKTPTALIPEQGVIDVTTTPQVYPLILAATSGNTDTAASNTALPIKINTLTMKNAHTAITANGTVTINNKASLTSANGLLQITNMQTLIDASSAAHNSKLKTGLILARFAGRNAGENKLEWDIQWQGNLFKVNNMPIPVW